VKRRGSFVIPLKKHPTICSIIALGVELGASFATEESIGKLVLGVVTLSLFKG